MYQVHMHVSLNVNNKTKELYKNTVWHENLHGI